MLRPALILSATLLLAACSGPLKVVEGECLPKPPEPEAEAVCRQPAVPLRRLAEGPAQVKVDARCHWARTGVQLKAGEQYRVTAAEQEIERWVDSGNVSTPLTGWTQHTGAVERFARAFSRAPNVPMYALVGVEGQDSGTYFTALEGRRTAARDGELLLFANDWYGMYRNNKGCLAVTVEPVR